MDIRDVHLLPFTEQGIQDLGQVPSCYLQFSDTDDHCTSGEMVSIAGVCDSRLFCLPYYNSMWCLAQEVRNSSQRPMKVSYFP